MTNPFLGFDELPAASAQPEVFVNAADAILAKRAGGGITINLTVDADYELEANDPPQSTDEWPYSVIRFTGSVLTATRHIIFPDLPSLYGGASRPSFLVINATNHTLIVRGDTSSGTSGVNVAAGDTVFCFFNGVDVEEMPGGSGGADAPVVLQLSCSDLETGVPSASLAAAYVRAALAMTLRTGNAGVRASVLTAPGTGGLQVDINKNGSTILSTKLTIDPGEKTSLTAAVAAVISNTSIAEDDEITIDIDDGGNAEGLIVTLIGTPT